MFLLIKLSGLWQARRDLLCTGDYSDEARGSVSELTSVTFMSQMMRAGFGRTIREIHHHQREGRVIKYSRRGLQTSTG